MSLLSERQLQRHRVALLSIACLQAFFTSGIFYGWASLYTLFLESGVYADRCASGEDVCAAQKERLSFIYTVAAAVNLCSQLPWGLVLDFLGPRVCNMWSTFLVIVGFVLLSLSARGVCDAYMPAMVLIAGAGPGAQISLFHLSELFPTKQKSTVLSVVTGAFQMSFVVFLIWQQVASHWGFHLSTLSMLYCIPLALLLLLGGVLWPDRPCIPPGDMDPLSFTSRDLVLERAQHHHRDRRSGVDVYSQLGRSRGASAAMSPEDEEAAEPVDEVEEEEEEEAADVEADREGSSASAAEARPLVPRNNAPSPAASPSPGEVAQAPRGSEGARTGEVTPPDYGSLPDPHSSPSLHYVHRSLHALRASRHHPNLKGLTATNPFSKQLFSPSFAMCLLWMSICIFWANFYIGTCVEQLYAMSHHDVAATRHYTSLFTLLLPSGLVGIGLFGYLTDVLGFSASSACTSLFGLLFSLGALYLPLEMQVVTFVAYSFFRAFLFSCMFAYLAHEFGYRHFGLLSGIVLAVGGALGSLQLTLEKAMMGNAGGVVADDNGGDGHEELGQHTSFRPLLQLQALTLALTFFFPVYVYIKQRMRVKRVNQQIQQHQRQLAAVY